MSVGVWEPKPSALTKEKLAAFVALSGEVDETVSASDLASAGVDRDAWVMAVDASVWALADELSDEELIRLVRLFTLIEAQVSGWDAGKTSPVIALVRLLKARDAFTPALRRWIKQHSDNRYLPYGSLL